MGLGPLIEEEKSESLVEKNRKNKSVKQPKRRAPAELPSTVKEMIPSPTFIHKLQLERLQESRSPLVPLLREDTAYLRQESPLAFLSDSAPVIAPRNYLPSMMVVLPLDKGRLRLREAFALIGWPPRTEISWTASGEHVTFLAAQTGGRGLDGHGRFLLPSPLRKLLRIDQNDSVLVIADQQPIPSVRIYSLSTVFQSLTHSQETDR